LLPNAKRIELRREKTATAGPAPQRLRVARENPGAAASPPPRLDAGAALQFLATVLTHERFPAAAAGLATELAATLGFDRVSIGFIESAYVRLAAVSHAADFAAESELSGAIAQAMEEALTQRATVVHPGGSRPQIALAHAALVRRHGGAAATIPLSLAGKAFGALTLQRFKGTISDQEVAWCEHLACFTGPILDLKRSNDEPAFRRLGKRVRTGCHSLLRPGNTNAKLAAVAALVGLLGLLFVPVEYHVRAPARLEGAIQRVLVAPMDGFLHQANARPGDAVSAGQVLVELAEQDLNLERRRRESELAQHQSASLGALARFDRTQYAISHAKASEMHAQLELVDEQLARGRVQAPFDGVIIKGDPTRSLGAPVQRGEVLLTIAPRDEYRLIVEVDERDVALIEAGQKGQLALSALPERTLAFHVQRVTPVSTAREGRNYFEVVAELDGPPGGALRPGLEGIAKISAGDRPLAWSWTHRFTDWLYVTLWSWGT
jgi:biotin carboxyl carrier protein